jgi:hypothetical protein
VVVCACDSSYAEAGESWSEARPRQKRETQPKTQLKRKGLEMWLKWQNPFLASTKPEFKAKKMLKL